MKKKVIITGANGLLGQKLVPLFLKHNHEYDLIATSVGANRIANKEGYTYYSLDITRKQDILELFAKEKPDYIINTAAMTNVDQCESEKEACYQLNCTAVEYLVQACEKHNTFLLHLSTDFIFDGLNGPYDENAKANPLSVYGHSKNDAEKIIIESDIKWAIARTVLVYGYVSGMSRSNIILWVKKSLEEKKPIKVVNDQWRTPTLAEDLAMGCFLIVDQNAKGIFNISGPDMLTPYDMAMITCEQFDLDKSFITVADSSNFTQPAKRPPRTGFNIEKAIKTLGYQPHSLQKGVSLLKEQLLKPV